MQRLLCASEGRRGERWMGEVSPGDLPQIPELDKDYQLVRELGRGGTAVVYLARDRELGRDVAIKLIRPGYVRDEDAIARLLREARTIGKLQHPSIVMLLGTRRLGEDGLALILQYMPGETLKDRIQAKGPFTFIDAERTLRDLGSALKYAHAHRIVHRDIKPENIYLDEALSLARLADFGIAQAWDSDSGLTMPGTAIGTPAYMSPEQVGGKELDGRSDLYSLGLVGYEILTGRQPWSGEGLYDVIYKQKHEELPPIADFRPDVPENLLHAIQKAIQKKPADRWKDAGEFLEGLAEGSALPPMTEGVTDVPEAEPGWEDPLQAVEAGVAAAGTGGVVESRKRQRVLLGVGAAALVMASIGLWIGGSSADDPPAGDAEGDEVLLAVNGLPGETPASPGVIDPGAEGTVGGEQSAQGEIAALGPVPVSVEVLGGDRQTAPIGTTLPLPLEVRVTDGANVGMAGVPVVFQVFSGGGSTLPERGVSGDDGIVRTRWTLGSEVE